MHRRPNTIERVDPDETKLIEVKKHPFGIIVVYIQTSIAMILAIGLAYFLIPSLFDDTEQAFLIASIFTAIAVVLAGAVLILSTYIYRQNRIIVTDRNITQILQFGLFSRKVSQLNIVNVEDVTSVQNGLLPTLFNYGELKIETAGEQSNFHFTFCPNSGLVAKLILDAREKMLGQMGDEAPVDVKKGKIKGSRARRTIPQKTTSKSEPKKNRRGASKSPNVREIGAEIVDHALDDEPLQKP